MTIYKDDIKLFASKNMTDTSDGGGEMTGVEIVTGEHNSIFPDVSDLDRAYGVVNLRSVHLAVKSALAETYYGATVGVLKQPDDPNVSISLMSVNDPYIMRDETRDLIERYLTKSAKYQGELLYTQLEGQRAVRLIQRTNISVPVAGNVLVLLDKATSDEQYVKIESVSSETQTFTDNNGNDFNRSVVTCVITEALRYEFTGVQPSPYDPVSNDSAVYETMVADAAKYYGSKLLTDNAAFAGSELKVDSIYSQLVPSARVDLAHVNLDAVSLVAAKFDMGDGTESELVTGVESKKIDVTIANQGYVYTATLVPAPSKGTTKVSFMAQGNWYELQDDGTGVLRGTNEAYGTGQLDTLGNLVLTLGALPDVDVPILIHYQNVNNYVKPIASGDIQVSDTFTINIGNTPVNSELSTITWDDKTATIVDGVVSGDMAGEYVYENGSYRLKVSFTTVPDSDTVFTISWDEQLTPVATAEKIVFSATRDIQAGNILNLAANMPPGSVKLTLTYPCSDTSTTEFQAVPSPHPSPTPGKSYNNYEPRRVVLLDNGSGSLIAQVGSFPVAGTINYSTGEVVLQKITIPFVKKNYIIEQTGVAWSGTQSYPAYGIRITSTEEVSLLSGDFTIGDDVTCRAYEQSTVPPAAEILAGSVDCQFQSSLPLELSVFTHSEILADTLAFNYNGQLYENVGATDIYSLDNKVGSIDLATGAATIYEWVSGSGTIELVRGVSKTGLLPESQYSLFKTAGVPVASQSLQVNAVNYDQSNINATTDADGIISSSTSDFVGTIDYQTGVVELTASGLLDTSSIKYNCVSYNYLPLDADQLGLDPIRLPSDGRVVIFKKGDVVVLHQDEEILAETVTDAQLLQLPHVRLVECTTTAGDAVIDLDAGTILFPTAGTYDINYYFEDMALLTYVDIAGTLKISRPLSHAYDADKAVIASVLIAGDLFARYTNLFDQSTWTGDFSDDLVGDEPSAEFNDTTYPLIMTNDGAITERWAIVFTSSTSFKLIGEHVGQVAVGDINTNFAPLNPVSGKPYFTLNKFGWGTGWATNNVLRFNSIGAVYQLNVIRTILQGESENPIASDTFALQLRGNINNEAA